MGGLEQPRATGPVWPGDPPRRDRLVLLQVLRGIAASLVVVDHSLRRGIEYGAVSTRWVHYADVSGALGVYTFFVISGLIMYRTSHGQFGSRGAAARFARRRILRVAPMYWLATAVWAVVFPPYTTWSGSLGLDTALSLLFVPYPITGDAVGPVLGVGWTLNYEMFFYALFAAAMLLPRRVGLTVLTAALVGLVVAGEAGLDLFYATRLLLLFVAGILLGMLGQAFEARRSAPLTVPRWVDPAIGATVLGLLIWTVPERDEGTLAWWVRLLVIPTLVVAWALFAESQLDGRDDGRLRPSLLAIGNASYSTYLTHSIVLSIAAKVFFDLTPIGGGTAAAAFILGGLVAANLVGWLTYRFVEAPLTRRLQRPERTRERNSPHGGSVIRDGRARPPHK